MKINIPQLISPQLFFLIFFFATLINILVSSCDSDDVDAITDDIVKDDDTVIDDEPLPDGPVLYDNVVGISGDESDVLSTESDLEEGLYIIEFFETPPEIAVNDIIVGSEGSGFLRRVQSIEVNGNIVSMSTTSANLREVFKSGTIEFTTNAAESERRSKVKNIVDLTNIPSLSPGFEINSGSISYNPNFHLKLKYDIDDEGQLTLSYDESILKIDCNFSINSSGQLKTGEIARELESYPPEIYTQKIGKIELVHEITTDVLAVFKMETDDEFKSSAEYKNDLILTFETDNIDDLWNGKIDLLSTGTSGAVLVEQPANLTQNLTLIARVNAKIQGVMGAFFQAELSETFTVNFTETTWDWNSELYTGTHFTYGIDDGIFGFADGFSQNKSFVDKVWNAPVNIMLLSGDEQLGLYFGETETQPLDEPLVVLITDSQGPLANVMVHYKVLSGGGILEHENVLSDATGIAINEWTLGNEDEEQFVEVTINMANGDLIDDSPILFKARGIDLSGTWILETTTTNCPEPAYYSFNFNPNGTLTILEDAPEIVSTGYEITMPDLELTMGITSKEYFDYICEIDEIRYFTEETGVMSLTGKYNNEEFRGTLGVSFTELPVNPCVYNFSCQASYIIHR